ncbi:MAG: alpha/beta hydrolase [Gemmatimonadota bacterium]|nr:alpha/beta hydrolase [Gemmatimonadota bacterium]
MSGVIPRVPSPGTSRAPGNSPGRRPNGTRRWLLLTPLAIAALGYLGAIAYLKLNERALVYHPDEYGGRAMVAPAADLRVEPFRVATSDSLTLVTWVVPPADSVRALGYWILVCHGNAGNISLPMRQEWTRALVAEGVGVVSFDYRSFGASDDGPLNEAALYRDARAVYDWMVRDRGIPRSRIIIYGHSLGSGVATELAANVEAAGLILEGAFTSVPDVGAERYPWLPVRLVAGQRFASVQRMDSIAMPKLQLHATDDAVIPLEFGQRLFAATPAPKEFVTLTGGHDRAFSADSATYYGAIGRWLRTLAAPDLESAPPGLSPSRRAP